MIVAFDAFSLVVPDVFIDTMGYAFTLALSKFLFPDVPTFREIGLDWVR